jgi:hypothetical protein
MHSNHLLFLRPFHMPVSAVLPQQYVVLPKQSAIATRAIGNLSACDMREGHVAGHTIRFLCITDLLPTDKM